MGQYYKIIIADYKQRTRSYAFLITLAVGLYFAYICIPPHGANYSTVRMGSYTGVQNAAWIGYVTAMMTSVFLALIGPYLINSCIKKDTDTGVGAIVATTRISNFQYLLTKAMGSFLVLLSIVGCVFLMAVALVCIRSGTYPFQLVQFLLPYLLITIPTVFFVSALSVTAEVFLYRYVILMNIGFFFFFGVVTSLQQNIAPPLDIYGVKPVTLAMEQTVLHQAPKANAQPSIGFIFGAKKANKSFVFEGIQWTVAEVLGRVMWMGVGLILIFVSSLFFHRFDIKQRFKARKKPKFSVVASQTKPLQDIKLSALPPITADYSVCPFIKTELLMLFRKGPRWLWLINLGGMAALIFAPITIAHQIILPVLWFLQVARWSDLATKEKTNRIHYFTYASYKPLTRLLPAQVMAGIILALALATPLMLRYAAVLQFIQVLSIIAGSVFIVLFAVAIGTLSGGKKLFEILFFLFTYLNIERAPFADYFGGINNGTNYLALIAGLSMLLALASFMIRKIEIQRV